MCDKSKRSKTIGIIIRNHQYVDGKSYRVTTFGESNVCYQSCCGPMRQSDTVDYRSFSQTAFQDCISVTDRVALDRLYITLTKQQEAYSAAIEDDSANHAYAEDVVDVKVVLLEPKPKKNRWMRFDGVGLATLATIVIVMNSKK